MTPEPADFDELLRRDRDAFVAEPPPVLSPALRAEIEGEGSLRARLSSLSTPRRVAVAVAAISAILAALEATAGPREDLLSSGGGRLAGSVVVLLGVLVAGVAAVLRPAHRSPLGDWARRGIAALGLLPAVLGAIPGWWGGVLAPESDMPLFHTVCLVSGLVVAVAVALVLWLVDRASAAPMRRALGTAGVAGLTSFVALQIHCPTGNWGHVFFAHGLHGVLMGAVLLLVWRR